MKTILMMVATTGSNHELSEKMAEIFKNEGHKVDILNLEKEDLPLFTPPRRAESVPDCVARITDQAHAASGFVFVGPEYNGSMPPVFNNAMAWISTSGSGNWRDAFNGKIALLATSSGGPGTKFQGAMTQQLNHIGTIVLPRMISINGKKPFNQDSAQKIIKQFLSLL